MGGNNHLSQANLFQILYSTNMAALLLFVSDLRKTNSILHENKGQLSHLCVPITYLKGTLSQKMWLGWSQYDNYII